MSLPTSAQILRLYKDLLRYGQTFKLSEKTYYINWIREEFREKKTLTSAEAIEYNYNVCFYFFRIRFGILEECRRLSYVLYTLFYLQEKLISIFRDVCR